MKRKTMKKNILFIEFRCCGNVGNCKVKKQQKTKKTRGKHMEKRGKIQV